MGEADLSGGAISTRRACHKSTNWLYARHPFGRRHAIATTIIKACSKATGAGTVGWRDALPVFANHSRRTADTTTRLLGRAARSAVEAHLSRRAARSATSLAGRTTGRAVEAGAIAAGIVAVDRPGRAAQAINTQPGYAHGAAHTTVFGIGPGVHALAMAERETGPTAPRHGEDTIESAESKHAPKGARCKGLDRLATRGGCRQRFGELVKFGGIHLHSLLC